MPVSGTRSPRAMQSGRRHLRGGRAPSIGGFRGARHLRWSLGLLGSQPFLVCKPTCAMACGPAITARHFAGCAGRRLAHGAFDLGDCPRVTGVAGAHWLFHAFIRRQPLHAPPVADSLDRFVRAPVPLHPYCQHPLLPGSRFRWQQIERFRGQVQRVGRVCFVLPDDLDPFRGVALRPRPTTSWLAACEMLRCSFFSSRGCERETLRGVSSRGGTCNARRRHHKRGRSHPHQSRI